MSASLPKNSLFHRLNKTPLRDLFRGQITARLDLAGKIAGADLPADAADLIKRTVRRTRLHRLEKVEVTDELIGHFRDALAQGVTPTDAARDFGDPAAAARLIRRAKKRNRSITWKIVGIAKWILAGLVAAYLIVLLRFFWGSPNPDTDFLAHLNAPARSAESADRAWPIYRDAWVHTGFVDLELPDTIANFNSVRYLSTNQEDQEAAAVFLKNHAPILVAARRAAHARELGLAVQHQGDWPASDHRALFGQANTLNPSPKDLEAAERLANESLFGVVVPHLALLRKSARLLAADTQRAAWQNDAARAMENLVALNAHARHSAETPLAINGLVGLGILALRHYTIESIVQNHPDLFSDAQLQDLIRETAAIHPRRLVKISGEHLALLDIVQRIYTDDGLGDGRITDEGISVLERLGMSAPTDPNDPSLQPLGQPLVWINRPFAASAIASRREATEEIDRIFSVIEREYKTPERLQSHPTAEEEVALWDEGQRQRHPIIHLFLPGMKSTRRTIEHAEARRDATLLALALEAWRRNHRAYPIELQQLAPAVLETLPVDRITGGPLTYRLIDGHPVIYSVGVDQDDDGGRAPIDNNGKSNPGLAAFWDPDLEDQPDYEGDWILYDGRPATTDPTEAPHD